MKIIQAGALPEKKVYKTTCSHCKTVFEFEKHEARFIPDPRDGSFLQIKCPLDGCGHDVNVFP